MKKELFKSLGIIFLLTFSFYYAKKISTFLIYKSPLMNEIIAKKSEYEIGKIEGVIKEDHIIPGLNGYEVSTLESYYQMKNDDIFNEEKLVYKEVIPQTNISNNQTLIINKANSFKRKVSIIVYENPEIEAYILKNRISANKLVSLDTVKKKSVFEQINYDKDYEALEKKFKEYDIKHNICVLNNYNKSLCIANNKYLVEPTYTISNSSLIKENISAGDIIMIDNTLSLSSFKILLQKIRYQDLTIDTLSALISEKR